MRETLDALCAGRGLSRAESAAIFGRLIRGEFAEVEMSALLVALKAKGESSEEIAGAAEALRDAATAFPAAGRKVADTCGTGGDGCHSVNISTAVALISAECGLAVAKHGNRAVSSRCGSADVLERCGVKIDASPEVSGRCLEQLGVCFLFAPQYHAGIAHVMPVRRKLGVRTIFNLVGPLANPARPSWQLVGVYDARLCAPVARTLGHLGCERALVVHGSGLDEIATHAPTDAALWNGTDVQLLRLEPASLGLPHRPLEALVGGTAEENSTWLTQLLAGRGKAAHNEVVALNAGALLWVAGRAPNLEAGLRQAQDAIRSGRAAERLSRWAEVSHGA
jgi:anthranilate phosphoribosyltransferase